MATKSFLWGYSSGVEHLTVKALLQKFRRKVFRCFGRGISDCVHGDRDLCDGVMGSGKDCMFPHQDKTLASIRSESMRSDFLKRTLIKVFVL